MLDSKKQLKLAGYCLRADVPYFLCCTQARWLLRTWRRLSKWSMFLCTIWKHIPRRKGKIDPMTLFFSSRIVASFAQTIWTNVKQAIRNKPTRAMKFSPLRFSVTYFFVFEFTYLKRKHFWQWKTPLHKTNKNLRLIWDLPSNRRFKPFIFQQLFSSFGFG